MSDCPSQAVRMEARSNVSVRTKQHFAPTAIQGLEVLSLPVARLDAYVRDLVERNPLLDSTTITVPSRSRSCPTRRTATLRPMPKRLPRGSMRARRRRSPGMPAGSTWPVCATSALKRKRCTAMCACS